MLDYLVTSKVRRRLLSLLWGEERQAGAAELAELAGVAFAGAHAELKAMVGAQLVTSRHDGAKEVYSANWDHPQSAALKSLVTAKTTLDPRPEDERVKRKLVHLGAPLRGVEPLVVPPAEQVPTLLEGTRLARRDPVVARCMPICFWKLREVLDVRALAEHATRAEDKHAVGFFLELTGELGGDRRFGGLAEVLRDRRMTSMRDFFLTARRGATTTEFPVAERWGFKMNADLESFRALFSKFNRR